MKNQHFLMLIELLISLIGFWQNQAYADCKSGPTMNLSSKIGYNRRTDPNMPNNQPITEWISTDYQTIFNACSYSKNLQIGFHPGSSDITGMHQGHAVFKLNNDRGQPTGIGDILDVKADSASQSEPSWQPVASATDKVLLKFQSSQEESSTFKGALRVRLIKIGPINDGQDVLLSGSGQGFYSQADGAGNLILPLQFKGKFRANRAGSGTCTMTPPEPVDLGTHDANELNNNGFTTATPFIIKLSKCTSLGGGTSLTSNVSFQIDGNPDPYSTLPSVLELDNPDTPNTAKGVGIQINYDDPNSHKTIPITLNQNMVFKRLAKGQTSADINFQARYIRENNKPIRGGLANATATIFIIYEN